MRETTQRRSRKVTHEGTFSVKRAGSSGARRKALGAGVGYLWGQPIVLQFLHCRMRGLVAVQRDLLWGPTPVG